MMQLEDIVRAIFRPFNSLTAELSLEFAGFMPLLREIKSGLCKLECHCKSGALLVMLTVACTPCDTMQVQEQEHNRGEGHQVQPSSMSLTSWQASVLPVDPMSGAMLHGSVARSMRDCGSSRKVAHTGWYFLHQPPMPLSPCGE